MNNQECPITCELITSPYSLRCGHTFEYTAINQWMINNNSCPVCRATIETNKFSLSEIKKMTTVQQVSDYLTLYEINHELDYHRETYLEEDELKQTPLTTFIYMTKRVRGYKIRIKCSSNNIEVEAY